MSEVNKPEQPEPPAQHQPLPATATTDASRASQSMSNGGGATADLPLAPLGLSTGQSDPGLEPFQVGGRLLRG